MTSFVNLLANDAWSEADIVARTEALIGSEFSPNAAAILNRKVAAVPLGAYTLSPEELAEVGRYAALSNLAQAAGVAARADMALLRLVWDHEAQVRRLALPVQPATVPATLPNGDVVAAPNPAFAADQAARAVATAAVAAATAPVLALALLRLPPVPPPPPERP